MIRRLLKPHTRKWFGALAKSNVWQAAMALQNVQWARSKKVCSVCGKRTTRDYRTVAQETETVAPATLRLCRACCRERQEAVKKNLQPLMA